MSPSFKRVASCRRCLWSPEAKFPPCSPESGAPGVSPVWAACTLLLWLCCNCCECAFGKHWLPGWLAARPNCNCYEHSAGWGWFLVQLFMRSAMVAVGVLVCGAGPLEWEPLWRWVVLANTTCHVRQSWTPRSSRAVPMSAGFAWWVGWGGNYFGRAGWAGHMVLGRLIKRDRNSICIGPARWKESLRKLVPTSISYPGEKFQQILVPLAHALILVNESSFWMAKLLFKLLPLFWDSEWGSLYRLTPFKSGNLGFPQPSGSPVCKSAGFQSQTLQEFIFLV